MMMRPAVPAAETLRRDETYRCSLCLQKLLGYALPSCGRTAILIANYSQTEKPIYTISELLILA